MRTFLILNHGLDGGSRAGAALGAREAASLAVALGVIKTPMHAVETYEARGAMHPIGHMGETSDVVDAIL